MGGLRWLPLGAYPRTAKRVCATGGDYRQRQEYWDRLARVLTAFQNRSAALLPVI